MSDVLQAQLDVADKAVQASAQIGMDGEEGEGSHDLSAAQIGMDGEEGEGSHAQSSAESDHSMLRCVTYSMAQHCIVPHIAWHSTISCYI